jgi:hypothetical protein
VVAKIVAFDAFVNALGAIEEARILRDRVLPPNAGLPALIMIIFVHRRIVAEQDEFVAMAAKAKIEFHLLAQVLLQSREPGFRSLPGVEWAIELVRAVRLVPEPHHEQAGTGGGLYSGRRENGGAAVIAIGTKSTGEISLRVQDRIHLLP